MKKSIESRLLEKYSDVRKLSPKIYVCTDSKERKFFVNVETMEETLFFNFESIEPFRNNIYLCTYPP